MKENSAVKTFQLPNKNAHSILNFNKEVRKYSVRGKNKIFKLMNIDNMQNSSMLMPKHI